LIRASISFAKKMDRRVPGDDDEQANAPPALLLAARAAP
jgi:hypothetical protein